MKDFRCSPGIAEAVAAAVTAGLVAAISLMPVRGHAPLRHAIAQVLAEAGINTGLVVVQSLCPRVSVATARDGACETPVATAQSVSDLPRFSDIWMQRQIISGDVASRSRGSSQVR